MSIISKIFDIISRLKSHENNSKNSLFKSKSEFLQKCKNFKSVIFSSIYNIL